MTQHADKAGIIYVAARSDRYLIDASLSAFSCRQQGYSSPITLFTDIAVDHPYPPFLFTDVQFLKEKHTFQDPWASGKFHKLQALIDSPYENTLYLDVDTRILSPDICIFPDTLADADIAMRIVDAKDSFCARALGTPIYNAGVIAFKQTATTLKLFKQWQALTHSHHTMLGDDTVIDLPDAITAQVRSDKLRKLLRMDQLGLYMLLNPDKSYDGVTAQALPAVWNNRSKRFHRREGTIIHHTSRHRRYFEQDLLEASRYASTVNNSTLKSWFEGLLEIWCRQ